MFGYYYNKSLRGLVVGFGSLFSNIQVVHNNDTGADTRIQVPITYASQEKFIQRLLNPSSITEGTRIENQLPRMSFHVNSITPDPSRRRSRFSTVTSPTTAGSCANLDEFANETPVNVGMNLFVYTRHIDDMLQIIEQIIPYFVPDHVIKIELTQGGSLLNIPVVLVSNTITDKYEGDFNSRRMHIASFNFIAKAYLFGKVNQTSSIASSSIISGFTGFGNDNF
jgi:hypothetical protein